MWEETLCEYLHYNLQTVKFKTNSCINSETHDTVEYEDDIQVILYMLL